MKKTDMILILGIVILDMVTKLMVQSSLALHESITVIKGFFYITYAQNTGAAWSLFSGRVGILTFISLLGVLGFMWLYKSTKANEKYERFAISLMIAGTLGNFFDRLFFGYVRDFLDFIIFGYDFPIFNVADVALVIGVGLLILQTLIKKEDRYGK